MNIRLINAVLKWGALIWLFYTYGMLAGFCGIIIALKIKTESSNG